MPKQKAKPVFLIKEWRIEPTAHWSKYVLKGYIFGREGFSNLEEATTSVLMSIDFVSNIAETKNSFYRLT